MKKNDIRKELIAPCGMDCGVCSGYLAYSHNIPREKGKISYCIGCRPRNKKCAFLKRDCSLLRENKIDFCFECNAFPCDKLKLIDDRYRTKYGMSVVENLNYIKDNGIDKFLRNQKRKYKCFRCGDTICIHNKKCYTCDTIISWKE